MSERPTTGQLALGMASSAIESYSGHPVARAIVTAIPIVGGPFDALLGTAGSELALNRLRLLIDELMGRLDRLEAVKQDASVTAEHLVDAAIRAVRGAVETGDQAKVRMIASILVGSTSVDRPPELDAESVLASLISLTSADLSFARQLTNVPIDKRYATIDFAHVDPGPDSQFRLMRLQGAGLVESLGSGSGLGAGPKLSYRFTETMWRILDLLRAGGEFLAA